MVQTYRLKESDLVLYSVSDTVGGRHANNDPLDVMLIQYLLNRAGAVVLEKPWGAGDLAVDGFMGTRSHYRLIHYLLTHYRRSKKSPQSFEVATSISPIDNAHHGTSYVQLRTTTAMGMLSDEAFMKGERPTPSTHLTPVDMPHRLAQELAKNVTDI